MKLKRHIQLEKGRLDVTPLIDVVFLLLIFFMLTSNFIFQPGIKINLPRAMTSEVIQEKSQIVTITGENMLYLNDSPITMKELAEELRSGGPGEKSLLIRADRRASLGKVVEIWDLCREAGVSRVNIATQQEI